jgi:hypothetical protein
MKAVIAVGASATDAVYLASSLLEVAVIGVALTLVEQLTSQSLVGEGGGSVGVSIGKVGAGELEDAAGGVGALAVQTALGCLVVTLTAVGGVGVVRVAGADVGRHLQMSLECSCENWCEGLSRGLEEFVLLLGTSKYVKIESSEEKKRIV